MTVNIVYANSADGYLTSHSTSFATALDGANKTADTSGTTVKCGTSKTGSTYYAYEAFESFTLVFDEDTEHVTSGHVKLYAYASGGTEALELRAFNWGASLTTSDWVTRASLTSVTEYAEIGSVAAAAGTYVAGGDDLLDAIRDSGTVYVVGCTTNQRTTTYTGQTVTWSAAEASGTTNDPALVYSTVALNTLDRVSGGQVQLSDGTWAALGLDGDEAPSASTVTVTDLATVDTGDDADQFGYPAGAQGYTLVVDDDDNLYVLGMVGSTGNTLAAQAYTYSGGTWTAGTVRTAALPTGPGTEINQVAAAWHDTGAAGTIVALVAHGYGDPDAGTDVAYLLLNCDYLLNGAGSLLRGSGDAGAAALVAADGAKETRVGAGSLLDVCAGSSLRGFACALNAPNGRLGASGADLTVSRYILATGGASLTAIRGTCSGNVTADGTAKARTVPIDETRVALVYADPTHGLTIEDLQNIGTASTFTTLGTVRMDAEGLTSLPDGATLAATQLWDATYNSTDNTVDLFYLDDADNQRLMTTSVDLSTHLATGAETEVNATVGASTASNVALRVERGQKTDLGVLVAVGNVAADDTLTTIYVPYEPNIAPDAPTLTAHGNFDADTETTFYWTFSDPNTSDSQSAYQLQVNDTDTASTVVDTGKVDPGTSENYTLAASTIANDADYQWRVRTYDGDDEAGPWSGYSTFSTSSAGVLNITDPVVEAEPNTAAYTVTWSVSGATQDYWRVVVTYGGSLTLVDTGWTAGADTSYEVTGMSSDVSYTVSVTARETGISTNTDTATITPSYATPQTPTIEVTAYDDEGYVLVDVTNPAPEGDEPDVTVNTVLRRRDGSSGAWLTVGQAIPSGEYRDYTAGSGVAYDYKARAVADTGTADSSEATATLTLTGVWLHDPDDPDGTATGFDYGGPAGKFSVDAEQIGTHYAGRDYPVFDYGEQRDDVLSVQVDVPFGSTWEDDLTVFRWFVRANGNTVVRDSRGRVVRGPLTGYSESDQQWGTQVSATVTQTDWDGAGG